MKINKILAAGVAATLAVTSLSAVASAEIKSIEFPMDYTVAQIGWNGTQIEWFGDNQANFIGAGNGAPATAASVMFDSVTNAVEAQYLLRDFSADGTAGIAYDDTTDPVTGVGADLAAAGKTLIDDAANTLTAKLYGAAAAGGAVTIDEKKLSATMKSNATMFNNSMVLALKAMVTVIANADPANYDESKYSASKIYGDFQTLVTNLEKGKVALDALIAEVKTADKDLDITELTNYQKRLAVVLDEAKFNLKDSENALLGDPLLADSEMAGIWLTQNAFKLYPNDAKSNLYLKITGAKMTIKGTKRGTTTNDGFEQKFVQCYNQYIAHGQPHGHEGVAGTENGLYVAFAPKAINRPGYINLNVLGTITDANITLDVDLYYKDENGDLNKVDCFTQDEFDAFKKCAREDMRQALWTSGGIKYMDQLDIADVFVEDENANVDFVTYANSGAEAEGTNIRKMFKVLHNSVVDGNVESSNAPTTKYAFVEKTQEEGVTIKRANVLPMSITDAYYSQNQIYKTDGNQTYYDSGLGTNPNQFGGLASQTADFFNHQNNGQIIMHFIDPAKVTKWVSNGIPSTEVGLRTALAQTAFALFFNYNESTGSIQTIGTVDKDALTVTFDMEDVLADFGGLTKANLHDIYYGCNNGLTYGDPYNKVGYAVDKVTLQYDDAPAAVDANTDDDADDDAAVVVADDDDDDDVVADDDDDDIAADDDIIEDDDDDDDDSGEIIADDDDDDDDVNNDVDYVDADDDANPGTGVGLAVIPAIVAGAALVVSKKRK